MPRKLRFYKPKQRKDDGVIPQPALLNEAAELPPSPLCLPLSLPLLVYLSAELPDLPSLQNRFASQWLRESFLGYLNRWEASVAVREGFTNVEKKRMLLSQETLEGLRMTTHSFIELVEYVFTIPDVKVFFSRRICQDPLEKFFGCQRQRGGTNENPSVHQFMHNTQALRVVNSFCRDVTKGNCRGNKDREASDKENIHVQLPRRPNACRRCKTPGQS